MAPDVPESMDDDADCVVISSGHALKKMQILRNSMKLRNLMILTLSSPSEREPLSRMKLLLVQSSKLSKIKVGTKPNAIGS